MVHVEPSHSDLANSLWKLLAPLDMDPFCFTSLNLSLGVSLKFKGCCAYQDLAKLNREEERVYRLQTYSSSWMAIMWSS